MSSKRLPSPSQTINKQTARRFMLAHQFLWPPRSLQGKTDVLQLIERLGCIQFDTINVVGRNADLVMQARLANYRPAILEEMLYQDRSLIDGWDKVASIFSAADWPYFARQRQRIIDSPSETSQEALPALPAVRTAIKENGPVSSLDFKDDTRKVDWFWSATSLSRAALELLYARGEVGIHHRVNTRRHFDLIERLLPADTLNTSDPNLTLEDYQDWHVLRRIGGLGLATNQSGEQWLGIQKTGKVSQRVPVLVRLVEQGKLIALSIEDAPGQTYFMRASDQERLQQVNSGRAPKARAAFIAPLDNLIWNRKTISQIFDFEYTWEVYKPKKSRQYGYYVLPVLYGDRFIARMDAKFERTSQTLVINNWWWEADIQPDAAIESALTECLQAFINYLQAEQIQLADAPQANQSLTWMKQLA